MYEKDFLFAADAGGRDVLRSVPQHDSAGNAAEAGHHGSLGSEALLGADLQR